MEGAEIRTFLGAQIGLWKCGEFAVRNVGKDVRNETFDRVLMGGGQIRWEV